MSKSAKANYRLITRLLATQKFHVAISALQISHTMISRHKAVSFSSYTNGTQHLCIGNGTFSSAYGDRNSTISTAGINRKGASSLVQMCISNIQRSGTAKCLRQRLRRPNLRPHVVRRRASRCHCLGSLWSQSIWPRACGLKTHDLNWLKSCYEVLTRL